MVVFADVQISYLVAPSVDSEPPGTDIWIQSYVIQLGNHSNSIGVNSHAYSSKANFDHSRSLSVFSVSTTLAAFRYSEDTYDQVYNLRLTAYHDWI